MAPEKRNEFLDASDSEDDVPQYDSDDDLKKGGRSAKRRKVSESGDDASDFESDDDAAKEAEKYHDDQSNEKAIGGEEEDDGRDYVVLKGVEGPERYQAKGDLGVPDLSREQIMGKTLKKNLITTPKAIKKSGVVYISRVPPFMKPAKLQKLLEPYGKINRIFLSPEDPAAHSRRVKAGGNKKRTFTDGWVEFVNKNDAKTVCDLLNARVIGGKKSNYYHDDVWSIRYLKGFKWTHLTEQIAAEDAARASRMRAEISKSTKENKEFVRNVEQAKVRDGIQAKAQAKGKKRKQDEVEEQPEKGGMTFKQIPQVKKGGDGEKQPEHVTRVLSKIF